MSDDEVKRLTDIETKVALQEDLLDTLNQLIYQQQKKLSELEMLCGALVRNLKISQSDSEDAPTNDRPPHY
jgi:SlyX protein